ncbi:MAG: ABC transporter ATP-binding protein [Bdellovibrionales bacterium]|nr:ABC transporter ATP-binding protein [Bdellovibrionales bacterium]
MEREIIYELKGVSKVYTRGSQSLSVLKNINLKIQKGQALCIMGPSGAGKSTLLHIMGTLDQASSGSVFYRNRELMGFSDEDKAFLRRGKLGFVFQFHHLLSEFTAQENILIPGHFTGRGYKEAVKRARFLMETLGISSRKDHYPSEMSGGEQQRVAIARALMHEPEVLLADEPVGNLDRKNALKIRDLFFDLQRTFQLTLVSVSHDIGFAGAFPRILRLEDGLLKEAIK